MYRAQEIKNEFVDKLVLNAKFFLMDIINKRMDLGIEEPGEDGFYTVYTDDFKDSRPTVYVWATDTYTSEDYPVNRFISEIHLAEDIYVVLHPYDENGDYPDDYEEEIYLRSLPLDSIIKVLEALEDYADETPDAE